jgi:hypothetical protein
VARRRYRTFVREGISAPPPWKEMRGGFLLGSEGFVARMRRRIDRGKALQEIPRRERLVGRPSLAKILGNIQPKDRRARNRAIARAYLEHGYRMNEVAETLGIHYATVSRAVRDHEEEMS